MEVTRAQFARLKGWKNGTVSAYISAKKILLTPAGLVDVDATEKRLKETADPRYDGVRARHARERVNRQRQTEGLSPVEDTEQPGLRASAGDDSYVILQKAKAAAEVERAALLRMEREAKEGALCETEFVRKSAFATSRAAMEAIMNLRFRIDPLLSGESDEAKRAAIWESELRAICTEIQRATDSALTNLTE